MNIYKILTFDGYSSRVFIRSGYDIISTLQNDGSIICNQIIRIELIGSESIDRENSDISGG